MEDALDDLEEILVAATVWDSLEGARDVVRGCERVLAKSPDGPFATLVSALLEVAREEVGSVSRSELERAVAEVASLKREVVASRTWGVPTLRLSVHGHGVRLLISRPSDLRDAQEIISGVASGEVQLRILRGRVREVQWGEKSWVLQPVTGPLH